MVAELLPSRLEEPFDDVLHPPSSKKHLEDLTLASLVSPCVSRCLLVGTPVLRETQMETRSHTYGSSTNVALQT